MFDRTSPVLTSSVQHPGWIHCVTDVEIIGSLDPAISAQLVGTDTQSPRSCGHQVWSFRVLLQTGRRHQIRTLFSYLSLPLLNDIEYHAIAGYDARDAAHIQACEKYHASKRESWYTKLASMCAIMRQESRPITETSANLWTLPDVDEAPRLLQMMDMHRRRTGDANSAIGKHPHSSQTPYPHSVNGIFPGLYGRKVAVTVSSADKGEEARTTYEISEPLTPWWTRGAAVTASKPHTLS